MKEFDQHFGLSYSYNQMHKQQALLWYLVISPLIMKYNRCMGSMMVIGVDSVTGKLGSNSGLVYYRHFYSWERHEPSFCFPAMD